MHGLTVLLLSACAALLGLCSGAELRGEVLGLAAKTESAAGCGLYPGTGVDGNGHPQGFMVYRVLVCSKNESLVIVQSPPPRDTDEATNFWVVNEVVNGCELWPNPSQNRCYPKECFSVQRKAPCPPCFGEWVPRHMWTNGRGHRHCKRD
jgi:hypothetical protein